METSDIICIVAASLVVVLVFWRIVETRRSVALLFWRIVVASLVAVLVLLQRFDPEDPPTPEEELPPRHFHTADCSAACRGEKDGGGEGRVKRDSERD